MTAQRPRLHFSPASGWINDPNGLIKVDGVYHIFYQADPNGLVHGPMHWGHASSRDLAIWREQPIALYPDADGQCFSGSAVAAWEGRLAEAIGGGDGILLFYTAHRDRLGSVAVEEQCLAVADRSLTAFRKLAANPVLNNPGIRDFRDPKVIWHEPTQRWVMVVTHGQSVGFYSSADALSWRFESEFGADHGRHGEGPWECPDLFAMRVDATGAQAWILVVGLGAGHVSSGSGTQYFVGDFDGTTFNNRNASQLELVLDWGRDYYAAQSFSGIGAGAPLTIAWMSNWSYANHTPATTFRGSMTLPRRLSLAETRSGLRLAQSVDPDAAKHFDAHVLEARTQTLRPASATYRLEMDWNGLAGSRLEVSLFGETEPVLVVDRLEDDRYSVRFMRPSHPEIAPKLGFATNFAFEVDWGARLDLCLFVDCGLVEIGCCSGLHWLSNIHFPSEPAGTVTIRIT